MDMKKYTIQFYFPHHRTVIFAGYVEADNLQEAVNKCYNEKIFDERQNYLNENFGYFPDGTQWEFKATNYHNTKETTHQF